MSEPLDGEVMRRAQMIMKTKGKGALEHAEKITERLEKTGDHDDLIYWRRIAMQIEMLIEGDHG